MKIEQLRNFYEICQSGSFRQAAKNRYISQEGLSYQIKQLEKELGYPLFYRGNPQTTMTEEGKVWMKAAEDILSRYDLAERQVKEQQSNSLCVRTWFFTNDWIRKTLDEYHQERPLAKILTLSEDTDEAISKLKDGKIDVLYLVDDILEFYPEISFLPIAPAHEGFLIHESHPLAANKTIHWRQLNGTPIIVPLQTRKTSEQHYETLLQKIRDYCPDSEILYGSDFAGCHDMVRYGLGVAATVFPDEKFLSCSLPKCRLIPHEPLQNCRFGIAYMKENLNFELKHFLHFQKKHCDMT